MKETGARRRRLIAWDVAEIGGYRIPCQYDGPFSDSGEYVDQLPTILVTLDDVVARGIVVGTAISKIETFSRRELGAHTVEVVRPQQDGAFVELQLSEDAA